MQQQINQLWFDTSFDLMNESRSGAAAFRPNELTMCRSLLSHQHSPRLKHLLTISLMLLLPSGFPAPLEFKFWWQVSHKSYILSEFHRPLRVRRVRVCDRPELPGATDGRGRTNNNRRMRAFPTTPLGALPTAPRPSLSATLIAMKFALERSAGCNFGRDRCNLGLGCLLGGGRWMPRRVIQVDLLQTNSLPHCHILQQPNPLIPD